MSLNASKRIALKVVYFVAPIYWKFVRPISVGARCIVLSSDQKDVLLVRHTYQSGWMLPGGGVKKGETLAQAADRELREECGIEIRSKKLVQVYYNERQGKCDHVALFVTSQYDGQPIAKQAEEIAEVGYFPVNALPSDATPATKRRLVEFCNPDHIDDRW